MKGKVRPPRVIYCAVCGDATLPGPRRVVDGRMTCGKELCIRQLVLDGLDSRRA